ncbi:MAG TPA: hypothetical protein VF342_16155 [Alphaproteobacteria bacterium]
MAKDTASTDLGADTPNPDAATVPEPIVQRKRQAKNTGLGFLILLGLAVLGALFLISEIGELIRFGGR